MTRTDRITEALARANSSLVRDRIALPHPVREPVPHRAHPAAIAYTKTRVARIPAAELVRRRVAIAGSAPTLVDSFRLMRTQIVQRMRANGWRTLGFTSAGEAEGKTFVAVNFAVSTAMEFDQTVLLVDADLRRPGVHACFGLPGTPGLANTLLQQVPLDHILVNPGIDRLVVLPAGAAQSNGAELLGSTRMGELVAEVRGRYVDRLVLFDCPPLLRAGDALALADAIDAFVLVVEEGRTTRDELEEVKRMMSGTNLLGVILNKSRENKRK